MPSWRSLTTDLDLSGGRVDPAGGVSSSYSAAGHVGELDPFTGPHVAHLDLRQPVLDRVAAVGLGIAALLLGQRRVSPAATDGLRSPSRASRSGVSEPSNGSGW
jgi:hypothetical protein